jgi:hypothetical protein
MKRKSRNPEHLSDSTANTPIVASEVPADETLASMESIGELENRMVDDANREEIESAERDYDGRTTDKEDGVIPMDTSEHKRLPKANSRKLARPPRRSL